MINILPFQPLCPPVEELELELDEELELEELELLELDEELELELELELAKPLLELEDDDEELALPSSGPLQANSAASKKIATSCLMSAIKSTNLMNLQGYYWVFS